MGHPGNGLVHFGCFDQGSEAKGIVGDNYEAAIVFGDHGFPVLQNAPPYPCHSWKSGLIKAQSFHPLIAGQVLLGLRL
jgi:hypothetical protein